MNAYTEIFSDTAPIQVSAILVMEDDEPNYDMFSICFKSTAGEEIETWDGFPYLRTFERQIRSGNLSEIDLSDSVITLEYLETYRDEIVELFDYARKLKMF